MATSGLLHPNQFVRLSAEGSPMTATLSRVFCISLRLVVAFAATDDQKNFSGAWKMDPARSESAHQAVPVGPITLVIKQTAAEITIETMTSAGRGAPASTEKLTYKLDGSENTMASASGAPIKTRARWDGQKLVTQTLRSVNGTPVTIQHVLSLGAG